MSVRDHMMKITDGRLDRSLTPEMDAVDIAIADMKGKLAPRLSMSGPDGARARIALACQEAISRAMAKEIDAGGPETGVIDQTVLSLGDMIAGMALKFTHNKSPAERFNLLGMFIARLSGQAHSVTDRLDSLSAHQISGVVAPRKKPVGSA